MKKVTQELPFCTDQENWSVLEEIAREGAKRMLMISAYTGELIKEIKSITEVKPMLTKIAEQIREEGENAKARETARRMLDKGYPLEDISEITSLSREEVEGLRKG